MCFESTALELKSKFHLIGPLEQLIHLYKYQEQQQQAFMQHFEEILQKISALTTLGQQLQNGDIIKSAFMLIEVMFAVNQGEAHVKVNELCMGLQFQVVDHYMNALNADLLSLNSSLVEDQLQLSRENPVVGSIMHKIDIIGCFIRMIYRVFEKITGKTAFSPSYYYFVMCPELSCILVRVFAFGVQIPNSPNNSSVIAITGLQTLDNLINQLKTKSLECINFLIKKKDEKCDLLIK